MVITYMLQIFWMFMFCCLVIITFALTLCWNICASERTEKHECIDFQQFGQYGFREFNMFTSFEKKTSTLVLVGGFSYMYLYSCFELIRLFQIFLPKIAELKDFEEVLNFKFDFFFFLKRKRKKKISIQIRKNKSRRISIFQICSKYNDSPRFSFQPNPCNSNLDNSNFLSDPLNLEITRFCCNSNFKEHNFIILYNFQKRFYCYMGELRKQIQECSFSVEFIIVCFVFIPIGRTCLILRHQS